MTDRPNIPARLSSAPRDPSVDADRLPRTPADIARAAGRLHLTVSDACMPGVVANLALLAAHAETVLAPGPEHGR